MAQDTSFGELIQSLRREKGWKVQDFIEKLCPIGRDKKNLSPAYITKIEVHGEIPNPEVICKMADVLGYDLDELLDSAKQRKIKKYKESLEEKYKKATTFYRTQKKKKK